MPVHLHVVLGLLVQVDLLPVGVMLERLGCDGRVIRSGPRIHGDTGANHRVQNREAAHGRRGLPDKAGDGRVAVGNGLLRPARRVPAAAGRGFAFQQDQLGLARGIAEAAVHHQAVIQFPQMRRGEGQHARVQALRGHRQRRAIRAVALQLHPKVWVETQVHVAHLFESGQRVIATGIGIRAARGGVEGGGQWLAGPQRIDLLVAAREKDCSHWHVAAQTQHQRVCQRAFRRRLAPTGLLRTRDGQECAQHRLSRSVGRLVNLLVAGRRIAAGQIEVAGLQG